ncbi:cytidine deaminase [Pochonia chlamydosporia 170]|uniref:Cytidine deaminase n=1 Tax=Pochonia chlamydosporia 170 TaxID=1380566 RepID=A0A179G4L0_METCM|nr:cytidine deaminase [Pochonia chlamydosporia 170]OAQ72301.1 cytidine deaminase [Pochonia chlamydosporia 170]
MASIAETCQKHALTESQFTALRAKAVAAKETAYCPYSKFRVGAAVLGADDSITTGANVENASYPVGTCAERVAFGKAVTEGGVRAFKAVAVATDVCPPASPCGMCRQFIREFCGLDVPVIMFDGEENFVVLTLEELLPMSFGPEKLQR